MDYHLEVLTVPVSDVDRALAFYTQQVGFALDVDYQPVDNFRVVQLTPAGSACSIQIGVGITDAPPGSAPLPTTWSSQTLRPLTPSSPIAACAPPQLRTSHPSTTGRAR